jgi:hypothetical protein
MMTNIDDSNSESQVRNDCDFECEVAKVEIGDIVVVIANAMDNDDLFYILLCNRPLHRCQETFEDEWGNT